MTAYIYKANTKIYDVIDVGTSGLTDSSFTKALYQDGAVSSVTLDTITEIGTTGRYVVSFTPTSNGDYQYFVYQTTKSFIVYYDLFIVRDDITTSIDDSVIETEGSITRQQAESIILSAVAGVTASNGTVFKDPSGTSTRITGTVNSNDERTAITLNPSS